MAKKMTKAEKNKARYIELNTLDRPLTDKEETELRFLEKRMEDAERIAQFKKNQAEPYASKRSRAVNLAWEFYRNIDIDGQCYVAVGGLDSITLYLFLRSIGINVPAVSVSSLEDKSIQKVHKALGVIPLKSAAVHPRIISMENVPEFLTWGPCIALRGPNGRVMKYLENGKTEEAEPGENVPSELRMLTPRELYNAQGFPPDYIIDRGWTGREYKKSDQVARCGNAVCPPLAEALVRANMPEWCGKKITTMAQFEDSVAI